MSKKERFLIVFTVFVVLIILVLLRFRVNYNNSNTLLDESLISFLAFSLLIVTSYMQYRMLNIQKEELQLQRNELELTRNEIKGQKEELENSNKINRLMKTDNMFFQLLNYKENIIKRYSINITDETKRHVEILERKIMFEILIGIDEKYKHIEIYNIRNQDIDLFYNQYQTELADILKNKHKLFLKEASYNSNHLMRVTTVNELIEELVEDKKVPGVFPYNVQNFFPHNYVQKLFGYTKPHLESRDIAEALLMEEEKDLIKLFTKDLPIDNFITLVKKYNPQFYEETNNHLH